jgi:hypothetical protein
MAHQARSAGGWPLASRQKLTAFSACHLAVHGVPESPRGHATQGRHLLGSGRPSDERADVDHAGIAGVGVDHALIRGHGWSLPGARSIERGALLQCTMRETDRCYRNIIGRLLSDEQAASGLELRAR